MYRQWALRDVITALGMLEFMLEAVYYITVVWSTGSVLLTQYCACDKIDNNEMGWACGAYG